MARSLVILGGAGFIGTAIRRAAADRYPLVSIDLVETPPAHGLSGVTDVVGEERYEADLGVPSEIDAVWERARLADRDLAAIIDLVAHYDFRNQPDPRYDRVITGLEHLLDRIGESVAPDVPFLYASSMAAMAPTEPGELLEPDSPRAGGWAYPRHKLDAEEVIESADIPHPRAELVLAAVYSDWCELVPLYQQIERVARQPLRSFAYPGPTDRGLTYVHVDDAADAFLRATDALHGDTGLHRLLIGEERPVTYRHINDAAHRAFGHGERPILRVPNVLARLGAWLFALFASLRGRRAFLRPWMVDFAGEHFEFDLTATRDQLGWTPDGYLGDRLDRICERAAIHRDIWHQKNEARPW